jgi:hypothetical protein
VIDRFVQNLRRVAGYDVQYFATVELQRRLAPHLHMAVRGTMPRAEVKAIAAATYHQVWWPSCEQVRYQGAYLPLWVADEHAADREDGQSGDYLDPETGELLPTWEQALDLAGADEQAEPLHVVRLGPQVDVKGVMAGSPGADEGPRRQLAGISMSTTGRVRSTAQGEFRPQDSFASGAKAGSFSRLVRTASAPYSNICRS